MSALEVRKMLSISTAHLRVSTREFLDDYVENDRDKMPGVIVYPKAEYGWLVFFYPDCDYPVDANDEGYAFIPADLHRCIAFAIEHDCRILDIDADGPVLSQLTRYWDEPEVVPGHDIYPKIVAFTEKYDLHAMTVKGPGNGDLSAFSICALNTDGDESQWIRYCPATNEVTYQGETDFLNIWLHETRPDFTPEKCIQFISDLNDLFGTSGSLRLRDLIDQEDWQEIAHVADASEDERYIYGRRFSPAFERVLSDSKENRLSMLARMKEDCKHYLYLGLRNPEKLWAKSVAQQISCVKALWNSFFMDEKPDFITYEEIKGFEESMSKSLLFSEVTLTSGSYQNSFLVGGIPRDADDLTDSSGYDDLMCEIEDGAEVSVHVEAYLFGDGESRATSEKELCRISDILRYNPDLLSTVCDNIESRDFSFISESEEDDA